MKTIIDKVLSNIFIAYASRILYRHIPGSKGHHSRAMGNMEIKKWGSFEVHWFILQLPVKRLIPMVVFALSVAEPERLAVLSQGLGYLGWLIN